MFTRLIFQLPLLLIVGCTGTDSTEEPRNDHKAVAALLGKIEADAGYRLGIRPDIEKDLATFKLDMLSLRTGLEHLVEHGSQTEKLQSVRLLGNLDNPASIDVLRSALADQDEAVRERACYALQRLKVKGGPAEETLARLCRKDSAIAVRVAAGAALGSTHDTDRVNAFESGLESTNKNVWETCEDELERMGKLRRPLPAHVYTEISKAKYQVMKADKWYWIQRETRVKEVVYLEVVERVHHVVLRRDWYMAR